MRVFPLVSTDDRIRPKVPDWYVSFVPVAPSVQTYFPSAWMTRESTAESTATAATYTCRVASHT